jgi:hypothetical protein
MARIRSRWMKPPRVYELTIPRSHNTRRITKIVHSTGSLPEPAAVSSSNEVPYQPFETLFEQALCHGLADPAATK